MAIQWLHTIHGYITLRPPLSSRQFQANSITTASGGLSQFMVKDMNMLRHYCNILFLCMILVIISSCNNSPLSVTIRFDEISGLKQGAMVLFDDNIIGQVKKISYTTQDDYLVDVSISPAFKNAATVNSSFTIVEADTSTQEKAIELSHRKQGGALLTEDTIVPGQVEKNELDQFITSIKETAAMADQELRKAVRNLKLSLNATSDKIEKDLDESLTTLSEKLEVLHNEVQRIPDREEIRQLESTVNQFIENFNKANKRVQDSIRNELLPQLKQKLEELRKKMKQQGREEEIEPLQQEVEELTRV